MKAKLKPVKYFKLVGELLFQTITSGIKKGAVKIALDQIEEIKRTMEGGNKQ